ncbi:MAG: DUF72 domain-containing protein [Fimbriimonadaceae bacterium]
MALYVGLSGFSYKPWQGEGRFYPADLKAKDFFKFYSENFNTVEMDSTWYRMPPENAANNWAKQAPSGFKYTFKMHRDVSHLRRLKPECIDSVKFFIKRLKPVLDAGLVGCIYIQLPPNMKRSDERLISFLEELPLKAEGSEALVPWGIEWRNETWDNDEVAAMMQAKNVAYVASDNDETRGVMRDTGPVIYARMRRETYTDKELEIWAEWFAKGLAAGKDVYAMFQHEDEGSPWDEAWRLLKIMGYR